MEFKGYGLMDELVERAMEKSFAYVRINHAYYNDADAVIMILELQKLLDIYEKAEEYTATIDADGSDVLYDLLKMYETMIEERYQFFTFYDEAIKEKAVEDMKKIENS